VKIYSKLFVFELNACACEGGASLPILFWQNLKENAMNLFVNF